MIDPEGYWCVFCNKFLPVDEFGCIIHDSVPHPINLTFDEEDNPQ